MSQIAIDYYLILRSSVLVLVYLVLIVYHRCKMYYGKHYILDDFGHINTLLLITIEKESGFPVPWPPSSFIPQGCISFGLVIVKENSLVAGN